MRHATTHPARSMGFLSRLHDGELTDSELLEFRRHIAECDACAETAAEFEAVLGLYRRSQTEAADPLLADRINRRLDARLRWRPPVRYVRLEIDLLWASVVATCLVAALTLYGFRASRRPPVPVSVVAETRAEPPLPEAQPSTRLEVPSKRPSGRRNGPEAAKPKAEFAPETARAVPQPQALASSSDQEPNSAGPPQVAQPAAAAAPLSAPERKDEAIRPPGSAKTTPPFLLHREEPVFPDLLRRSLRPGASFMAQAVIDESGDVSSIRVLAPVAPGAERPIVEALRRWKYKPAVQDGRPVSAYLTIVIYFTPG